MSIVLAGVILFFGSIVQGAIGFALGMIAVPLLVEAGFSLSQSIALTTLAIGIQVIFGAWKLRADIPWSDVKLAAIVRFLTVPIGVLILLLLEDVNSADVKPLVGIGVLIGVGIRALARRGIGSDLPIMLSIGIFALSGILQGLVAMGGPPLVLWMTARDFPARQARAFTVTLFLLNAPLQVLLLLFLSRTMSPDVLLIALLLTPLIYLGTIIGLRIGDQFSKRALNHLALAVLVAIAINAII